MALSRWSRDGRATLLAATLGIGLGVSGAVAAARSAGWLQGLEFGIYDRFLHARSASAPPSSEVAVVLIREEEILRHGHPLPDPVLVQALEAIAAREPRAVGVDLYRAPPRAGEPSEGWEALASFFQREARAVLIEKLPQRGDPGVPPPAFAAAHPTRVGFSDVVIDADGVVRRGLLILWPQDGPPSLSLALQLALVALAPEGITLAPDPDHPDWVRLGASSLPAFEPDDGAYVGADAGGYQLPLDFAVGSQPRYDLQALLEGKLPEDALRDRVVLLGTSSHSVKDDFVTAHSGGDRIAGVELHAHAADQLLRLARGHSAPLRHWSDPAELALVAAAGLAGALAVFAIPSALGVAAALLGLLGALAAVAWYAFASGLWIPLVPPGLSALAASGLVLIEYNRRERAERRAVMDLFGRYVSRTVADDLWMHRDEYMDGGRPRPQTLVITSMLTDLKGYTSAAERLRADALMSWVNEYMDAMTRIIEAHGGIVDDYTGDGIKANFGVPRAAMGPERIAADARSAVRCALEMGQELDGLVESWRRRGLPVVPMRVGLFTGEVVGGSLGSSERMKYTTVGDTVNTAARLESLHKDEIRWPSQGGAEPNFRILIGHTTRDLLGEEFELEDLGEHEMRGRAEPVHVYRVRGLRDAGEEVR